MKILNFLHRQSWILLVSALGSALRLIYGLVHEPWLQGPDHLAWELVLQQGSFSYDHLIHYPHEGGTILISLFCQMIRLFSENSLIIAAFILDFIIRFLQIFIVERLFGKRIAAFFGIWTILGATTLIPWATVNFGLHYVSSIFPFLFLYLLDRKSDSFKYYAFLGIFLGLALWFSYSNMTLVLTLFAYLIFVKAKKKEWAYTTISFILVLCLHIFTRWYLDPGFHLREFGLFSIRGADFSIFNQNIPARIALLFNVIGNAFYAIQTTQAAIWFNVGFYIILCASVWGVWKFFKGGKGQKLLFVGFTMISSFLVMYLLSPFYYSRNHGSYVMFRHLSYILPLIALFVVLGLHQLKTKYFLVGFFILGSVRAVQFFNHEKLEHNLVMTKASGWILGLKLGHDPERLSAIVKESFHDEKLLIQGIGWGISASSLFDVNLEDLTGARSEVRELVMLLDKYPKSFKKDLLEGIAFSFGAEITPKLDQNLLIMIEKTIVYE